MHRAPGPELRAAAVRRDRLGARVTVLGNALALAATAGTGVITGVLAHSAQAADLQKAQAKAQAEAAARAAAGPQVRLVPKPVKVVTVKVRARSGSTSTVRKVVSSAPRTTTARRSTSTRTTATRTTTTRTTTQAPTSSSNPPATTSSGS